MVQLSSLRRLGAAALLLVSLTASAQPKLPDGVTVNCGTVNFGNGVSLAVYHFNNEWRMTALDKTTLRPDKGDLAEMDRNLSWSGGWTVKGGAFHLAETIAATADGSLKITADLTSPTPVATNNLCFDLNLPVELFANQTVEVDGKPLRLPEEYGKTGLLNQKKVHHITLKINDRLLKIDGEFDLLIQDNRQFNINAFSLRLANANLSGSVTQCTLSATLDYRPIAVSTIDLRPVVNMGFADDVADDRQGGWTDQGKDNDLRAIPVGRTTMGGIAFDLIDPAKNQGRSCLVLAGPSRDYFPGQAGVELVGSTGKYLYLLHGAAWTPSTEAVTGKMIVTYDDNSTQTIPVRNKVDVANWWRPGSVANAAVVWTTDNREAYVGLFLSAFELEKSSPRRIEFQSEKNAVWMIVGASLSETKIEVGNLESPQYITANQEWRQLRFPREIQSGSALDFSHFQDAPAGKYGRAIVMPSGGIAFEKQPQKRVRFYGANLCYTAQYLEHAEAEKLADYLAKMGYNSIRMHHIDQFLTAKDAKRSTQLNPDLVEKMDYLFYCLKNKGIYITIDLYCSRLLRPGEIPEFPQTSQYELKMLIPLFDSARENWKEYVRTFLAHTNPYTGMSWAEDPTLFMVNLVNENTIFTEWKNNPGIKKFYDQRFQSWLKEHGFTESADNRAMLMNLFLAQLQDRVTDEFLRFLRDEIKIQALVTDNNFVSKPVMAGNRSRLDLVDNHDYWDHPTFPGRAFALPNDFTQRSAISAMAAVPRKMMPSRIFGKPFVATEFNYCFPNAFRSEGGALIGAYAALQDWDGLYRFAWAHSRNRIIDAEPATGFDTALDPVNLLADRLAILLFLRGDVAPARNAYVWECPDLPAEAQLPPSIPAEFPDGFSRLGLISKIGSCVKNTKLSADIQRVPTAPELWSNLQKLPANLQTKADKAVSDTGEIELNATTLELKVMTPRTEALVLKGGALKGKALEVRNAAGFQTVAAAALDNQPLTASRKILFFQLTDIVNTKIKFGNRAHTRLDQWGTLPLLLRAGKADIRLTLTGAPAYRVTALTLDGSAKATVPSTYTNGVLEFTADTTVADGTMLYLIEPAR